MAWCIVPNCESNKLRKTEKISTFKVPNDDIEREKWRLLIGVKVLRSSHRVCEKHFNQQLIVKEYIKYDKNNKIIAQVSFKHARLMSGAIPTILTKNLDRERSPERKSHDTNKTVSSELNFDPTAISNSTQHNEDIISLEEVAPITFSTHSDMHLDSDSTSNSNFTTVEEDSQSNIDKIDNPESIGNENTLNTENDSYTDCDFQRCPELSQENGTDTNQLLDDNILSQDGKISYEEKNHIKINSAGILGTFTFSFDAQCEEIFENEIEIKVPKPWSIQKSLIGKEEVLLCTYVVENTNDKTKRHIFEKSVIIKASKEIIYEVYATTVNVPDKKLPGTLQNIIALPEILKKFKDFRICKGISCILPHFFQTSTLKTCTGTDFRHKNCLLLSFNCDRCRHCKVYYISFNKILKKRKQHALKSMSSANPVESLKLQEMKKKLKLQARRSNRLKRRLLSLINSITDRQQRIACLPDNCLDKISKNQKLVVQEIINASKRKDSKGRCYTDEFIMLCLLMNIKSKSYYEFLRTNDIIPLPCIKSIQDYMTVIAKKDF